MKHLRSRAAIATIAMSCLTSANAATIERHSFGSSIMASAISKFRNVKDPGQAPHKSVATSVQIVPSVVVGAPPHADPPPVPAKQIKADVLPKKDGPPADVPAQKQPDQKPPEKKAADQPPAQPTTTTSTQAAQTAKQTSDGTITASYATEDIKQVMSEVAGLAGVSIVADDSIKEQSISVEFKGDTIEQAVNRLALMAGAYWKLQAPGLYLISKATPETSLFPRFAETKIYHTKNQNAANIQAMLSASYKAYVSVDPKTSTIGVMAPKQLLDKILEDIEQADRPNQQVMIEAEVTEINVEDSLSTGFSWNKNTVSLGTDLSLTYSAVSAADLFKIQATKNNHKMRLRANPHLISIAGRESTVNVGQDTYYSILSGSTIYPTSQIQLIHTGVILKFTALVGDDGMITMHLEPSVSDSVVSVNGNPTSNIRNATTDVRVKSGQPIVIAGLIQETGNNQIIRVPILGYIPIIGEIFTQRTKDKKKVETIFIITPRLLDQPAGS